MTERGPEALSPSQSIDDLLAPNSEERRRTLDAVVVDKRLSK